jgi:hypothetical protein
MNNLYIIKYKRSNGDNIKKIEVATGKTMAEFNPKQPERYKGLINEMNEWLKIKGNEIEPQFTTEESEVLAAKEHSDAYDSFKSERDSRINEADGWEIPSFQKREGISQEQVEEYKQYLCDITKTLTKESKLEDLKNPPWQPKLTEKILV